MKIIAGTLKNREIITPKGLGTRPTSAQLREALFNICQSYIEGARFLDLFAGSGALGLEAISRGATSALFVESSRNNVTCIQQNLKALQIENQGKVVSSDVIKWLNGNKNESNRFDIVFADPPYGEGMLLEERFLYYGQQVLLHVDQANFLSKGGMLFIEESKEAKVNSENVKTLKLVSTRRFGRSTLYQYEKQ